MSQLTSVASLAASLCPWCPAVMAAAPVLTPAVRSPLESWLPMIGLPATAPAAVLNACWTELPAWTRPSPRCFRPATS